MTAQDTITFEDVINAKNFTIAWKQIRKSLLKDLIKDPIENVDYEINLADNIWNLLSKINNKNYTPKLPLIIEFAKGKGLYRPVAILEIEDLIVFQSIIIKIAPRLDKLLPRGIYAVRSTGNDKKPFKGWYNEWPKYQKKIHENKDKGYDVLVVSDISAYFENIDHGKLKEIILQQNIDKKVVDLLFYLLETWTHRPNYSANLYRGIPQTTNQDCSNFLSNIFLHEHDEIINKISVCKYSRWIDDMNIAVRSEVTGKTILKTMSGTLRDLYLYPNTSKTKILTGSEIDSHFLFDQNDYLDIFKKNINLAIENNNDFDELEIDLIKNYEKFLKLDDKGNWFKILKRYYTTFKNIRSTYLLNHYMDHLKKYPTIDESICSYLLALDFSEDVFNDITGYITSQENLYDSVEIQLLDLLLKMRVPVDEKEKLLDFGKKMFFDQNRHWYSKCISALIIAKYGEKSDIRKLSQQYYQQYFEEEKLRKHLIAISTLLDNSEDTTTIIDKAKEEYSKDIQNMINIIDSFGKSKQIPNVVWNKMNLKEIHLPDIKIKYIDIRIFLLLNLASSNSHFHSKLKTKVDYFIKYNSDPVMDEKLRYISHKIS